jgi:PEP-CTERM motif
MKSLFKFTGAALFLISAPLLRADSILFNMTTSGHSFSFTLPSQQAPDQSGKDFENLPFFFFNNVAVTVDGVTTNQGVLFGDNGDQSIAIGNKWRVTAEDQVVADNFFEGFFEEAQSMFSGPAANPTFIPGSENGFFIEPGQVNEPAATLEITKVAQTPEPGSFALFGSGLLGFAGVMRRKLAISR